MENFAMSIKPTLENFFNNSSKENACELRKILDNADSSQIRLLENYILAPLILKLDKLPGEKSNELKYEILNCIKCIIFKSRVRNVNQLKTIIIIMIKQIYNFETGILHKNLSEEIKLVTISCINESFNHANTDVLQDFYCKDNSNVIGKIASVCVDVLQNEKYKILRISAIKCLQFLFFVHNDADFNDIMLRNQVADSTFFFLPKIIAVLTEIALDDEKIGEILITLSIQTLGRILHIIYEDKMDCGNVQYSIKDFVELISENKDAKLQNDDDLFLSNNIKNKSLDEKIKIIRDMNRSQKWFEASSKKLKPIFLNLQILQSNSNTNFRKEYMIFVTTLLEKCNRNLKENISILVESLIALSQDDEHDIKKACEDVLKNIEMNYNITVKWDVLFNEHMTKLPRIINRKNESEQITEFLFLKGFFEHIPEESLHTIFNFVNNLEKFINNIIETLTLEFSNNLLYEQYFVTSVITDLDDKSLFHWMQFVNISSLKVVNLLKSMCQYLGMSSVNLIIYNCLIDILNLKTDMSNEILLFLTFMLSLKGPSSDKNKKKIIDLLLQELSEEKHWHLALLPDEKVNEKFGTSCNWYIDRTPGLYESAYEVRTVGIDYNNDMELNFSRNIVNRTDAKFNVLYTCVVLNAIGNCALILEKKFEKYIFKILHRVLLKSNSTNVMVHNAGLFALLCIKKSLNCNTIPELVQNYSDYLSHHINSSLKKRELNVIGIDILSVVLQYSSLEIFTYLEAILYTILNEMERLNDSTCTLAYLKVFNVFFIKIQEWINIFNDEVNNKSKETVLNSFEDDLLITLKNILDRPVNEFEIKSDIIEKNQDEKLIQEEKYFTKENEKSDMPKHIVTVRDVLKEILKFISSKDQMIKIISLECIICGLPILRDYEDEVLPLIHLLWYPYSERFKDNDPVVLNRCFDLLRVLADCSKNFLQKRIIKDVYPFLNQFLESSLKNSFKNKNITSTQELKLQSKLLQAYAKIIIDMDMSQDYVEKATDIVILYLNSNQPQILQESAFSYFIEISKFNKALVYIKLYYCKDNRDFKNNIQKIFSKINIKT